jgi:hypothetical protein
LLRRCRRRPSAGREYPMVNPIDNFTVFRVALPPDAVAALARR